MIYPNLLLIYKLIKIYEGIVLIAFFGLILTEGREMASSKAKTFKRQMARNQKI